MRLDLLLYRLRLAKSRGSAQSQIGAAHIRCNRQRVLRQNHIAAIGDVLTMPYGKSVLVIEILALPRRRGPAAEAKACYRVLDAG